MANLTPDSIALTDRDGTVFEVPVRLSTRARRMSLRVDPSRGGAELVIPPGLDLDHAERFAQSNIGWLRTRLAKLPARVTFEAGAEIPILGVPHVLRHRPDQRGGVWKVEDPDGSLELHVAGEASFLARRVTDHLKAEARKHIAPRARGYAAQLERKPGRITMRDTRSRWGSCSSRGDLSFSWRLVLAPEAVLDYVVAHEAAHLLEMNHSARFWRVVEHLMPDYERHQRWLKRHGGRLHGYG
jgi:predicted metal-dependent hydrolase